MSNKFFKISLYCRVKGRSWFKVFLVPPGTSAEDVLTKAKHLNDFPLENIENLPIGIYSNRINYSYVLQDGDRLEIYEPLILTPEQARSLRAEIQASKKGNNE